MRARWKLRCGRYNMAYGIVSGAIEMRPGLLWD